MLIQSLVIPHGEKSLNVTISLGVTFIDGKSENLGEKVIFSDADTALYEAKNSGRNKMVASAKK